MVMSKSGLRNWALIALKEQTSPMISLLGALQHYGLSEIGAG
jgi:hypothetical protein